MKTLALLMIVFACAATPAMATPQRPDLIAYDGVLYELHTPQPNTNLPLESAWPERKDRPNLSERPNSPNSTACWRGYVAIWQIEDDTLYLAGLDAWQGDQKADLKKLFPDNFKNGRVKADWFTGGLSLHADKDTSVALVFAKGKLTLSPNKILEGTGTNAPAPQN
jgi:hypothetical protein